jgi:hypothetical protein
MKTEEQYHFDWLSLKEGLLSSEDAHTLQVFIQAHSKVCKKWESTENDMALLRSSIAPFSNSFNSQVLSKMYTKATPFFDKSSMWIASIGIAASLLLMLNLFVEQNSWDLEALLGIADMDTNNTNLLFYINSSFKY